MRRREFITTLCGAAAWPMNVRAQPSDRVRRIGVLMPSAAGHPEGQARIKALQQALHALGWTDGGTVRIDYRWAADLNEMQTYAKELAALTPHVILVSSNPATAALLRETRAIPVVFASVADPVGSGFVKSLAQPGGNATGFSTYEHSVIEKWLELLKEVKPGIAHVAMIHHPQTTSHIEFLRVAKAAAPLFGVTLTAMAVQDAADIAHGITAFAGEPNGGLVVAPHPVTNAHYQLIIAHAAQHRLPAVYPFSFMTTAGGLISYSADAVDLFRRSASYIDRILKGTSPSDLPVQQPTKFELVINLKTAKALGITVPSTLLARADEVIE